MRRDDSDARNPSKRPLQSAVALAYRNGEAAPKVVAKGRGLVAEQIIAVAAEAGVYVHESKELVSLLMDIDLDRQIPPTLYRVIAELLAWLYHIEAAQKAGEPPPPAPDTSVPVTAPPAADTATSATSATSTTSTPSEQP